MLGGTGADWFVMSGSGTGELDRIKDFEQGTDLIVVRDAGFTTFAQLQAVMTVLGPSTIINLPIGGRILIENILPGDLTANDFVLERYDAPNILACLSRQQQRSIRRLPPKDSPQNRHQSPALIQTICPPIRSLSLVPDGVRKRSLGHKDWWRAQRTAGPGRQR